MRHIFADCFKVEKYNFTGWNTASLLNLDGIFNSNKALKSVDVSDFDTATVTNFAQVFDGCTSLEEIIGLDQWDTRKGTNFGEFLLGTQMVAIDLSSFDMSSAKTVLNMFHVNPKLTTIYVGDNWNLNPATLSSPNGMFGSSTALKGANGNTTRTLSNSAIYARVDTPETPGLLTHINDKPVAP
jgi:surface protein